VTRPSPTVDYRSAVRRSVPDPLVPVIVRARLRRALSNEERLADAREQMDFVLGRSRPEVDLEGAAHRYLDWMTWRSEVRWHTSLLSRQHIEGLEHLARARDQGRGVVLNFMHHGSYDGLSVSMSTAGFPVHSVVEAAAFAPDAPAYLRQRLRRMRGRVTPVSAGLGTRGITDLVSAGHIVQIATDVPGRTPVTFFGRRLLGSSGAARIACTTGAPVVVVTMRADPERRAVPVVHPALDPADFTSAEALLETLLAVHEESILALPEALNNPLTLWGQLPEDPHVGPAAR
jgi:lauroyl/myristoyl acyltransferase